MIHPTGLEMNCTSHCKAPVSACCFYTISSVPRSQDIKIADIA